MKLLAIAINTIRHGMRMKFVIAFVFFLIAVVISAPFTLKSDTQSGRVQIILAYSLGVLNIILSLLTIFLSTSTFCSDIRDKTVFTIDTKPVKRWEILAGKWIGVNVLLMILLVCAGVTIYGFVKYAARPLEGKEQEQFKIKTQVLTARVEAKPEAVDGKKTAIGIPPRHEWMWEFNGIKPSEDIVHIKFRNFSSGGKDAKISGLWTVGNMESGLYRWTTSFPGGSFHEFQVPASLVSPEGKLNVKFMNISAGQVSAIFPHGDMIVLYRQGGFGKNFFRGIVLILLRLAFISAIGIVSSTFLTFPVATLFSIFVLVMSLSLPFINALLGQSFSVPEVGLGGGQAGLSNVIIGKILKGCLKVFPDLRMYDPVQYVVNGLLIRWALVLKGFAAIVFLRCGVIGVIAHAIFNRRELANMGYL